MSTQARTFPYVMQRFRGLPGTYGSLDVTAKSRDVAELQFTQEFVEMNRTDAQELVRVLSEWLAIPGERQVVRTQGEGSEVVILDQGPGRPAITVVDQEKRAEGAGSSPHYQPAPEMLPYRPPT